MKQSSEKEIFVVFLLFSRVQEEKIFNVPQNEGMKEKRDQVGE